LKVSIATGTVYLGCSASSLATARLLVTHEAINCGKGRRTSHCLISLVLNVRRHFVHEDVTSDSKLFQVLAAATGNARLSITESRVSGRLQPVLSSTSKQRIIAATSGDICDRQAYCYLSVTAHWISSKNCVWDLSWWQD